MWVQRIDVFGWVQRGPCFPQILLNRKRMKVFLGIQWLQNGDFQRKVITQIGVRD